MANKASKILLAAMLAGQITGCSYILPFETTKDVRRHSSERVKLRIEDTVAKKDKESLSRIEDMLERVPDAMQDGLDTTGHRVFVFERSMTEIPRYKSLGGMSINQKRGRTRVENLLGAYLNFDRALLVKKKVPVFCSNMYLHEEGHGVYEVFRDTIGRLGFGSLYKRLGWNHKNESEFFAHYFSKFYYSDQERGYMKFFERSIHDFFKALENSIVTQYKANGNRIPEFSLALSRPGTEKSRGKGKNNNKYPKINFVLGYEPYSEQPPAVLTGEDSQVDALLETARMYLDSRENLREKKQARAAGSENAAGKGLRKELHEPMARHSAGSEGDPVPPMPISPAEHDYGMMIDFAKAYLSRISSGE